MYVTGPDGRWLFLFIQANERESYREKLTACNDASMNDDN